MENKSLVAVVVLGMLALAGICLWRITSGTATQTEALLLSVILALASTVASWVGSKFYSDYSFDKNQRIFALKASEKVITLSDELVRLSVFLQQELDTTDYESPKEALLAKDSRIEAAIHIINTLKSVNDRSLSDWQGVIGDQLTAQREVQQEREEELRDLLERVESLPDAKPDDSGNIELDHSAGVTAELESIRKDLRSLASQVSGVPIRASRPYFPRQRIEAPCPSCGTVVAYRQRPKPDGIKGVSCTNCATKLCSRHVDGKFMLEVRKRITEQVVCPNCGHSGAIGVDPIPGSSQLGHCTGCGSSIRITRLVNGIRVRAVDDGAQQVIESEPVDQELLERIQAGMPPQPWPTGASKELARRLRLPHAVVSRGVKELIHRGIFKMQIDGQLYEPRPSEGGEEFKSSTT